MRLQIQVKTVINLESVERKIEIGKKEGKSAGEVLHCDGQKTRKTRHKGGVLSGGQPPFVVLVQLRSRKQRASFAGVLSHLLSAELSLNQ